MPKLQAKPSIGGKNTNEQGGGMMGVLGKGNVKEEPQKEFGGVTRSEYGISYNGCPHPKYGLHGL
jgi:hypothetical protein